jgi:hypothetical protein
MHGPFPPAIRPFGRARLLGGASLARGRNDTSSLDGALGGAVASVPMRTRLLASLPLSSLAALLVAASAAAQPAPQPTPPPQPTPTIPPGLAPSAPPPPVAPPPAAPAPPPVAQAPLVPNGPWPNAPQQVPSPYGAPPPYAQPQGDMMRPPIFPAKMDYIEGAPIPAGYRETTQPRFGLAVAGWITFGVLYTSSVITGGGVMEGNRDASGAILFLPVVGPVVGIGTLHADAFASTLLVLDTLGQSAGLAMGIAAFAAPAKIVVKSQYMRLEVGPVGVGSRGPLMGLRGAF